MSGERGWRLFNLTALAMLVLGAVGCLIGAAIDVAAFCRAWLCAYLLWLGVPLAAVTLTLVHDLSGGRWMIIARRPLAAAILTMPLVTLASIPAFAGLHSIYGWTHPGAPLGNNFYLNEAGFAARCAGYAVLWNGPAAFALWGPRGEQEPIAPALSWISGLGLVALAFSTGFAAIDWILSLEPGFWSSAFPYAQGASWFNTGLALVLLGIAVNNWRVLAEREHIADVARILLATTIFWAYVEFIQFLIIWEGNLRTEIHWYLVRLAPPWTPLIYVDAACGFVLPFFLLLWTAAKRSRVVVAAACALILVSRLAERWWLVLPEFSPAPPFWLDAAAMIALGGAVLLLFGWGVRRGERVRRWRLPVWRPSHG